QRGDASGSDDGSQGGQGVSDRGGSDSRSGTGETTHFEWRGHHGGCRLAGAERRGSSSGPIVNEILGGTRIPGVTMDGRLAMAWQRVQRGSTELRDVGDERGELLRQLPSRSGSACPRVREQGRKDSWAEAEDLNRKGEHQVQPQAEQRRCVEVTAEIEALELKLAILEDKVKCCGWARDDDMICEGDFIRGHHNQAVVYVNQHYGHNDHSSEARTDAGIKSYRSGQGSFN
ncbi:unnamed protein product, partial [Symbiodinium necroappetens]